MRYVGFCLPRSVALQPFSHASLTLQWYLLLYRQVEGVHHSITVLQPMCSFLGRKEHFSPFAAYFPLLFGLQSLLVTLNPECCGPMRLFSRKLGQVPVAIHRVS